MKNYYELNQVLLSKLSSYLNDNPCLITTNQINKLTKLGVSTNRAFSLLLQEYLEIDDETIINEYFPYMIKELNPSSYTSNPYYQNISFKNKKLNNWELKNTSYEAYEAFVCGDFQYFDDGRVIPQIGYFSKPFKYLAVYQNKHLWMSITPNEIETMKDPLLNAKGNVVTIGLGMGYFAYMASLKENVSKVTIVEIDPTVIKLFKEVILPNFKYQDKIEIIESDAFLFLDNLSNNYDYLFIDIWHDVSDGKDLYLKFKEYEKKYPNITFDYWVEKTIKYYL
ncbi:MAG: hypothetical protein IJX78_05925 [Bacilli bacterium]|nr:hypothetical protein [Bacilli bacterium]